MSIATSQSIGADLCKALGLEARKVRGITLRARAYDVVTVVVHEYVEVDAAGRLIETVKRYRLVPQAEASADPPSVLKSEAEALASIEAPSALTLAALLEQQGATP